MAEEISENRSRNIKTGLIFDDKMTGHYCLWDSGHIETPKRYLSSLEKLKKYGLIDRCHVIPSRTATESELLRVHTEKYINEVKNSKLIDSSEELEQLSSRYDSVYFNRETYDCALLAAGCSLELVSSVLKGTVRNGLAVVRPPGHHAMVQEACGFCFFNNVAIAAKYALDNLKLNKILIIDWDVHHGQGTQQIFYDDPRVLYFSIHRFQNGDFWPNLKESHFNYVGGDSAQGFNINVPLNCTSLENGDYLAIFNNILLPIAYEFNPELVLVSAGYDAAIGCPEGEMRVTPLAYPHFLNSLSCLANGRICVILEGGYCLSSLSESVAMTLRGLLGDPCPSIPPCIELKKELTEMILNVISVQRPFWDSIKLQNVYDVDFDDESEAKHRVKILYTRNPREGATVFKTREDYPVQPPHVVDALEAEIKNIVSVTDLSVPEFRTGFTIDLKLEQPKCSLMKHFETSAHIVTFYRKLLSSRLLSKCILVHSPEISAAESALHQNVEFLHTILKTCNLSSKVVEGLEKQFKSFELCEKSDSSAYHFSNLLQLVEAVVSKACVNGYAVVQPFALIPDSESKSGFVPFSSIAIAAKYLTTELKVNKVLIVDLDVLCSSSLQKCFYDDDKVLYMSLHYEAETTGAKIKKVGEKQGKGYTINIPFQHMVLDGDYLSALFHIMLPVTYEYGPEFVLINLGVTDCSNHTHLTPSCFGAVVKLLSSFCSGRMVVVSEGNLSSENAPDTAAHCLSALLGEHCAPLRSLKPSPEGIKTIQDVVKVQKEFWKSLAFDVEIPGKIATARNVASSGKCRESSDLIDLPNVQGTESTLMVDLAGGEMFPDEFFCVTPLENCPHLELLQPIPAEGLNIRAPCTECKDLSENWVCLHCYQVYCGRFVNQHMLQHGMDMNHYLTLSYSDLSVWCYACESYIHNNALKTIKDHACD